MDEKIKALVAGLVGIILVGFIFFVVVNSTTQGSTSFTPTTQVFAAPNVWYNINNAPIISGSDLMTAGAANVTLTAGLNYTIANNLSSVIINTTFNNASTFLLRYQYQSSQYVTNTTNRTLVSLVPLFFLIGIVVAAAFVFFKTRE